MLRSEFLKVFLREVPTRMRTIHVSSQDEWTGRYLGKTKAFSGIVALGFCRERLAAGVSVALPARRIPFSSAPAD
jgi:hypothetical protein